MLLVTYYIFDRDLRSSIRDQQSGRQNQFCIFNFQLNDDVSDIKLVNHVLAYPNISADTYAYASLAADGGACSEARPGLEARRNVYSPLAKVSLSIETFSGGSAAPESVDSDWISLKVAKTPPRTSTIFFARPYGP